MTAVISPDLEAASLIICALVMTVLARVVDHPSFSVCFDIMGAVFWFALASIWVFSSSNFIISIAFLGMGVISVVLTISDALYLLSLSVRGSP